LGAALRQIHTAAVPEALWQRLPQETFSPKYREQIKGFLRQIERETFADPAAAALAAFLKTQQAEVWELVEHTEQLAQALQAQPWPYVVCHTDLHAGNILLAGEMFYIVDWDAPLRAPPERDLMFAGGGQFGSRRTPAEEERLFYAGYGPTPINARALAYYRYERIIQDLATYGEQLFLTTAGGADREQALRYVQSNFLPVGTIAIARAAEERGLEN
jgi:spectinomycin phosphotransferase